MKKYGLKGPPGRGESRASESFATLRMTAGTRNCDDNAGQHSWDEEEFAGGLAGFEVAVGVSCVGERVDVFEAQL
jgi:hypothetical protein